MQGNYNDKNSTNAGAKEIDASHVDEEATSIEQAIHPIQAADKDSFQESIELIFRETEKITNMDDETFQELQDQFNRILDKRIGEDKEIDLQSDWKKGPSKSLSDHLIDTGQIKLLLSLFKRLSESKQKAIITKCEEQSKFLMSDKLQSYIDNQKLKELNLNEKKLAVKNLDTSDTKDRLTQPKTINNLTNPFDIGQIFSALKASANERQKEALMIDLVTRTVGALVVLTVVKVLHEQNKEKSLLYANLISASESVRSQSDHSRVEQLTDFFDQMEAIKAGFCNDTPSATDDMADPHPLSSSSKYSGSPTTTGRKRKFPQGTSLSRCIRSSTVVDDCTDDAVAVSPPAKKQRAVDPESSLGEKRTVHKAAQKKLTVELGREGTFSKLNIKLKQLKVETVAMIEALTFDHLVKFQGSARNSDI